MIEKENIGDFVKETLDSLKLELHIEIQKNYGVLVDALIRVDNCEIGVEYKKEVFPQTVRLIEEQAMKRQYFMLVSNYITPKAKEMLEQKHINYIDSAQNIYLQLPQLLIKIKGNRVQSTNQQYRSRAFSKSGAAIVYQFLMGRDIVNAPQRLIAEMAKVSLGTVPKVLEGLQKEGYLIKFSKNELKLIEYEKLLQKWVQVLHEKLLPAHYVQRYKAWNRESRDLLNHYVLPEGAYWGGEAGAALLTRNLHPEKLTIFTSNSSKLVTDLKLMPSDSGDIFIYKTFWNESEGSDYYKKTVHPILLYADLVVSDDSRLQEISQMIYDEHIKKYI